MVISRLHLKLFRDIRSSPLIFTGIVLLIFVGIALFDSTYSLYLNLQHSYTLSYRSLNLSDFAISVKSAPQEMLTILRRIPGIRRVDGRVIQEVEIEQNNVRDQKVFGRIISIPDTGIPAMNQPKLVSGAYPKTGALREILLEASFAKYHHYKPGDLLSINLQEDKIRFRIVGIVQSPEYIYVVRGREYPMASPQTFGVMWMRKSMADELFDTAGSINDLDFQMADGGNRETAIHMAEQILQSNDAEKAVLQEELPSVELLRLDLQGLKRLALFFPILFLTISCLSVYNLMGRMVQSQRRQIGFLRAMGVPRKSVGTHYLLFSLVIGSMGGLLGSAAGYYLGILITKFYISYIQIPYLDLTPQWGILSSGFLLAIGMTILSGYPPAKAAARLMPAEAIGTDIPFGGRTPVIEKFIPALKHLSLFARLPFRNFIRSPRRSLGTVAGVVFAAVLLITSSGLQDSSIAAIDHYFTYGVRYDILASYTTPQSQFSTQRIKRWPGIKRVEPILIMPAKVINRGIDKTILIYGVPHGARLITVTDTKGNLLSIPAHGLTISKTTADKLNLCPGSMLRLTLPRQVTPDLPISTIPGMESLLMRTGFPVSLSSYREELFTPAKAFLETKLDKQIRISLISYQPFGTSAYASLAQVQEWYGNALELPPHAVNLVAIQADPKHVSGIVKALYQMDGIGSVEVTRDIQAEIDEMMRQSRIFFNIMLSFSIALAGIIVLNATLMNIIERTREIATLRTVGVSIQIILRMIWIENLLIYIVGIFIGLPLGSLIARFFVQAYESESMSLQTVIFPRTYWVTAFGILFTVIIAQKPGIQYIRQIEIAKATKDFE